MTWTLWACPNCRTIIELNDEAPVEAWCSTCDEGMLPVQDEQEL
jgi:hypothetical protein